MIRNSLKYLLVGFALLGTIGLANAAAPSASAQAATQQRVAPPSVTVTRESTAAPTTVAAAKKETCKAGEKCKHKKATTNPN